MGEEVLLFAGGKAEREGRAFLVMVVILALLSHGMFSRFTS